MPRSRGVNRNRGLEEKLLSGRILVSWRRVYTKRRGFTMLIFKKIGPVQVWGKLGGLLGA